MLIPTRVSREMLFAETERRTAWRQTFEGYPDGRERVFVTFDVSTNASCTLGVTLEGDIIAIERFEVAAYRVMIELPGGINRPGGSLETEARRALREKTGFTAGRLIRLSDGPFFEPSSYTSRYIPWLALGCEEEAGFAPSPEIRVIRMPVEEWLGLAQSGHLLDSKSMTTTLLAVRHLDFKLVHD